jgi:predicted nucleic acid-binding protein
MPNSSRVCCDANFVVRLVTFVGTNDYTERWETWQRAGLTVAAPPLLRYEVTNAIHRIRRAGHLTNESALLSLRSAFQLPIEILNLDDLHERALGFAGRLNLPAAYDAHYLALADQLSAEFWTADRRLYNAVNQHLAFVRFFGA